MFTAYISDLETSTKSELKQRKFLLRCEEVFILLPECGRELKKQRQEM